MIASYDENTSRTIIAFNATFIITYSIMNRNKLENFFDTFDSFESMVQGKIDELTCGNITVNELTLTSDIQSDKATLTFHGELVGEVSKALASLINNYPVTPLIPVNVTMPKGFLERLSEINLTKINKLT